MAYKPKQCYLTAKADALAKAIDKCAKALTVNDSLNSFEDCFSLAWTKCDAYNNALSKSVDIVENSKSLRSALDVLYGAANSIKTYQQLYKKYEKQVRWKNMYKNAMNAHQNDEDKHAYNSAKRQRDKAKKEMEDLEKQLKKLEKSIEGAIGV